MGKAIRIAALSGAATFTFGSVAHAQSSAPQYDTIIHNGMIVDGSGLQPYRGDVAIQGGHIVAVGNLYGARAGTEVDASGMIVAPGFINIHSHAQPAAISTAVNMLTQGVTTEITNADGHGTIDIVKQLRDFAATGLAENIGLFIGFNAAWRDTVGNDDRRATREEIAAMQGILDHNLAAGAWGVAAGLDYKPGYFADKDEVIEVVSAVKKWRTIFPNHERLRPEEHYSSFKGMTETVEIGEQSGILPVITHLKTQGAEQGNAPAVIKLMADATARGVYTPADIYPYLAGHSGLSLMVPGWAHVGGQEAMLKRFKDPETRAKIIVEAEEAMNLRFGGAAGIRVLRTGLELTDAMKTMNARAGEALIRLIEQGESSSILTFGREDDLVAFLKYPNSAIACDCGANIGERIHPRNWGSFPRVLGHYVRDAKVLTLPDAIRRMSALPATIVGMSDRGYLAPGMTADVVVFDPKTVADHATYEKPTLRSDGVRDVFVNGNGVLRGGKATGMQGGQVVLRTAYMPSRPMTVPNRARSISGKGEVAAGGTSYSVSFAISQKGGSALAGGQLKLADGAGGTWTADRFGTIQTAPGWASVTAVLRNTAGKRRPVTLTIEQGESGGAESSGKPLLVLSLDGQKDVLTGPADVRIHATGQ